MKKLMIALVLVCLTLSVKAQIHSQWRGPQRSGVYPESNLLKKWPDNGPEMIWFLEGIGAGHSSPSILNNHIFLTGKQDSIEWLFQVNMAGEILWKIPYGKSGKVSYPEARCTPTIEGDRIYVISGSGEVICISVGGKKIIWSVNAFQKFNGSYGTWGIAESPLLVKNMVIYTPGGNQTTLVALDKYTGETVWKSPSLNDFTAYVSPILIEYNGIQMIVQVTANHIIGVDVKNGDFLWTLKYSEIDTPTWHPNAPIINAVTPIYHNGKIYITSGYNHVGVMLKLSDDGRSVSLMWKDSTLDTHIGGVVLVDGFIYGSNWISNSEGNWVCLDWNSGKVMYEKEWETKGSIISADGMLICYEEKRGHIALLEATSREFQIQSIFQITKGRGPHWAHPVINNGVLYVRHGDVLMAYHIRS